MKTLYICTRNVGIRPFPESAATGVTMCLYMLGYKYVGSSNSPELWPDFMQEAYNSYVWQFNGFQEAPRIIAKEVCMDSGQTI